jgi:hypothetical protein
LKGIVTNQADIEGIVLNRRPSYKLGEVIKIGRLDFVLKAFLAMHSNRR